jgi:hypothetical protein
MASKFNQGYYAAKNVEKYVGDLDKIRYMSSWELNFFKFLDGNPNVLRWSSENIAIPYMKPTDGRIHKYYPDIWIEYRNRDGEILQEILEIKPKSQVTLGKRPSQYEQLQWAVNVSKWKAAQAFCQAKGIKFRILTEDELFSKGK